MKKRAARPRKEYSVPELRFIYQNRRKSRDDIHAAFVRKFRRRDISADNIKAVCTRYDWIRVPRWTDAEIARLRKLYPSMRTVKVAAKLGRPLEAVYRAAKRYGIDKTPAYMARRDREGSARLIKHGAAHRFHKGQVPPNKGKKMPGYAPGRMATTQFKKGVATNWHPIGTDMVHVSPASENRKKANNYWYRKISDVRGVPWTKNWKALHIIKWEQLHGPMPKRHALKCLDGNQLNTDPANWILISRAELLHLNRMYKGRFDTAAADVKPLMLTMVKHKLAQAAAKKRSAE